MEYSLFADESGTSPPEQCFTIGCLLVPHKQLQEFEDSITQLIEKHNLPRERELKWSRVKKSYGMVNFLIDLVKLINISPASFICKVAWKKHYFNWQKNEEVGTFCPHLKILKKSLKKTRSIFVTFMILKRFLYLVIQCLMLICHTLKKFLG